MSSAAECPSSADRRWPAFVRRAARALGSWIAAGLVVAVGVLVIAGALLGERNSARLDGAGCSVGEPDPILPAFVALLGWWALEAVAMERGGRARCPWSLRTILFAVRFTLAACAVLLLVGPPIQEALERHGWIRNQRWTFGG